MSFYGSVNLGGNGYVYSLTTDNIQTTGGTSIVKNGIVQLAGLDDWTTSGTDLIPYVPTNDVIISGNSQIQMQTNYGYSGKITTPIITDNGDGTVNIGTCTVYLKATVNGLIHKYTISAVNNQALTDNTLNYVKVSYNSGTPVYLVNTTVTDIDYHTIISVAQIYRDGTKAYVQNYGIDAVDPNSNTLALLVRKFGLNWTQGIVMSTPGINKLAVTTGSLYFGTHQIIPPAFNSNVSGSFHSVYYNGTSWISSTISSWDSFNRNNIATGLVPLNTATSRGFYDVYLKVDNNDVIYHLVYCQANYATQNAAETAPLLTFLPTELTGDRSGVLYIGRMVFQKSAGSAASILSAFTSTFTPGAQVTSHSNLSDLTTGDDHTQYGLIVGRTNQTMTLNGTGGLRKSTYNTASCTPFIGSKKIDDTYVESIAIQASSTQYNLISMCVGNYDDVSSLIFNGTYTPSDTTLHSSVNVCSKIVGDPSTKDLAIQMSWNTSTVGTLCSSFVDAIRFRMTSSSNINTYILGTLNPTGTLTIGSGTRTTTRILTGTGLIYSLACYDNIIGGTNRTLLVDDTGLIATASSLREHKTEVTSLDYHKIIRDTKVHSYKRKKLIDGILTECLTNPVEVGVYADECELVYPDACGYDQNGNLRGVEYSRFIMPLVYVVQEQKKEIDTLKTTINNLILRLNSLESQLINHLQGN